MNLQEAKEQIAKDNKFSSWEELCKDNPYDPVFYENQALNLVLSSKDKELQDSLKLYENQNQTIIKQAKEITELKESIQNKDIEIDALTHGEETERTEKELLQIEIKGLNETINHADLQITSLQRENRAYQSDVEKFESELSQLKEQNLQLSEQLDQDGDVIQSLQEEIKQYAHDLKNRNTKIYALQHDNQKLVEEMKKKEWISVEQKLPSVGVNVLGQSSKWVDADFNPDGIRICWMNDEGDWTSAKWDNDQDSYHTHAKWCCEKGEYFDPEKWKQII